MCFRRRVLQDPRSDREKRKLHTTIPDYDFRRFFFGFFPVIIHYQWENRRKKKSISQTLRQLGIACCLNLIQ